MDNLAEIYSDYLIASFGLTTATGLSNLLDGAIWHDKITRFLAGQIKTSKDLWQFVKPLIRDIESDAACLIIDDSIEEKPYTDENDIICWHYDHSQERLVKGINFLSCLYQTNDIALPMGFALIKKLKNMLIPKMVKKNEEVLFQRTNSHRIKLLMPSKTKSSFALCYLMSGFPVLRI